MSLVELIWTKKSLFGNLETLWQIKLFELLFYTKMGNLGFEFVEIISYLLQKKCVGNQNQMVVQYGFC